MDQVETDIAQGVTVALDTFRNKFPGLDLTEGQMLLAGLLFAGMILQPLLMVFLGRMTLKNPLRDRGGLSWLMAGGTMVYAGAAIAGNGGEFERFTMNAVLEPLWRILM